MTDDTGRVEVRISANITDLRANLAIAEAQMRSMASAARSMADDMVSSGKVMDTGARASLASLVATASAAKANATEIKGMVSAAEAASAAMSGLGKVTSGETVELIRLGHEAMTGNFSRIPGSLVVMASRMGNLNKIIEGITPTMLGAGSAALAFAGGLGLLITKAAEAQGALDEMKTAFAGNAIQITDDQLKKLRDQIIMLPDITTGASSKLVFAFAQMKGASFETMRAIADLIPAEMGHTGLAAEEAAKKLISGFEKAFDSANPRASVAKYFGELQGLMEQQTTATATDMRMALASTAAAASGVVGSGNLLGQTFDKAQLAATKKTIDDIGAAIKVASQQSLPALPMDKLEEYANAIKQFGTNAIQTARDVTSFWEDQRATVLQFGGADPDEIEKIDAKIAAASGDLAKAQAAAAKKGAEAVSKSTEEQMRSQEEWERAAQEAAKRDKEAADRIIADWQRASIDVTKSITDANVEIAKLGEGGGGKGQSLDQRIGSLAEGAKAQLAALKADFQNLLPQGSFDQAIASVSAFNVATGNTSDLMRQLGTTDAATFAAIVQDVDKARVVMADYGEKARQAQQEAAEQSSRVWTKAFSDIDGSVKTFLSDVIERHKSAGLAAEQAVGKLVTSWVEGIAEIMVKLTAFEALKAASGLGGAIGGVASAGASALGGNVATSLGPQLARMLGIGGAGAAGGAGSQTAQLAQLTTAITGNTSQTLQDTTAVTSNTGGVANWVESSLQNVAQLLGLTTATTTQTVTTTTGLIPSIVALTAAVTANTLAQSVGKVSSVAGIANAASASGAAASGGGFLSGLASIVPFLAEGTASVGKTGLAVVHAGEAVLPASIAPSFRPFITGGAARITGVSPQYASVLAAPSTSAGGGVAASTGASGGGGSSAPAISPSFGITVNALDARSVMNVLNTPTTARALAQLVSRNMPVT